MSLFNNAKSQDNPEQKWKDKYLKLLDEQEAAQNLFLDEQQQLCKTIVRLCLVSKGLDKIFDPFIQKIRAQLKNGINSLQLKAALDEFNDALLKIEDAQHQPEQDDTRLLFDFLYRCFPDHEQSLQLFQKKYAQAGFASGKELLVELSEYFQAHVASGPVSENNNLQTPQDSQINIEVLVAQFSELLSTLEIPPEFEARAATLKARLNPSISFENLRVVMDDYIDLLNTVKNRQQLEQKEMAVFLSNLTEQLNELGMSATGATVATQLAAQKRNLLDQSVSAQMSDLQKSSAIATTLEPLKQLINTRLQSIGQEIQIHAKNEELQRAETERQLRELTSKINALDEESKELKSKLLVAHSKATRDALTGLANRLAYDENVSIEISRWRRYGKPLSMIVWDIDFFKKINDTYGHKAGDKTLIIIANLLTDHSRESDFVARLGGEEFIMLLPNTIDSDALIVANKIRSIIANTGFNSGGERIRITVSCGISQFKDNDTSESVFERADQALYQAKQNGRNQCILN